MTDEHEAAIRADQTRLIVEWLQERACRCWGKDQDHAAGWWSDVADAIHRKFGGVPPKAKPAPHRVRVTADPDGGFIAEYVGVPGPMGQGETKGEATASLVAAREQMLAHLRLPDEIRDALTSGGASLLVDAHDGLSPTHPEEPRKRDT